MTKSYFFQLGSANPATYTGLAPTMTIFSANGLTAVAAPGITETPAASGFYRFIYGPTLPMVFKVDGTASVIVNADRFVKGVLDPAQAIDEQVSALGTTIIATGATLVAIGVTVAAIGTTLSAMGTTFALLPASIGSTASSFGSTSTDPGTIYGYLMRLQELMEGNAVFNKSTGVWDMYSRGSSTLLREKTLTNSSSQATKT